MRVRFFHLHYKVKMVLGSYRSTNSLPAFVAHQRWYDHTPMPIPTPYMIRLRSGRMETTLCVLKLFIRLCHDGLEREFHVIPLSDTLGTLPAGLQILPLTVRLLPISRLQNTTWDESTYDREWYNTGRNPRPPSVEPPWTVTLVWGTNQTLVAWPTRFLPSGPQWGLQHPIPTEIHASRWWKCSRSGSRV